MDSTGLNSGVSAQTGFALQRNSAIYILLNNYHEKFISPNYFLCLEHHDDFIFCFLGPDGSIKSSEVYQSKKKSPDRWTVNTELTEILIKLLKTGIRVRKDSISKTKDYQHKLHFSSNSSIFIKSNTKGIENITVDETQNLLSFDRIPPKIQTEIISKLKGSPTFDDQITSELSNLHFLYIEITRTAKEQRNQLIGKLGEVFGNTISDQAAAIDTLFRIFQKIELIYNQVTATLSDSSKRVTGEEISNAFHILTTQSKAFDYWRSEARLIAKTLTIKPFEKISFEQSFISAFDFFKILTATEHQKILDFTCNNYRNCQSTNEEECVLELMNLYQSSTESYIADINLKSIFYAAYFHTINKREYA